MRSRAPEDGRKHAEPGKLKPNTLGLVDVVFMAIATSAPITAMSGNVPFSVGYGVGWGTPAPYVFATLILSIFAVAYVAMARYDQSGTRGRRRRNAGVVILMIQNLGTAAGQAPESLLFKLIPYNRNGIVHRRGRLRPIPSEEQPVEVRNNRTGCTGRGWTRTRR